MLPDPVGLTLFVMGEKRYSATEKLAYLALALLVISVALSVLGLLLMFLTEGKSGGMESQDASSMYATYYGILLIGLPATFWLRKLAYARYAAVYMAAKKRKEKRKSQTTW